MQMTRINRRILGVLATALFGCVVYLLAWSSIFSVSAVSISGAPTPTSKAQVASKIGIELGVKLARVDARQITRRLETFPWIEQVHISKNWISRKVSVEISPRVPIAFFNPASSFGSTIDKSGKVFSLPGGAPASLPRVEASTSASGVNAIALFTELPSKFRGSISLMNASRSGSYRIYFLYQSRTIAITWGDSTNTSLKTSVVEKLLTLKENSKIRSIDVSAPHAPIVR